MNYIPNSTRVKVELLIDVGPNATSREPHLHVGELLRRAIRESDIYLPNDTLDFPLESAIVREIDISQEPKSPASPEHLKDSVDVHVSLAIGSMVDPAQRTPESIVRIVRESLVDSNSVLGFKGDFTDESRGIIVSSITVGEVQDLPSTPRPTPTQPSVQPPGVSSTPSLELIELTIKLQIGKYIDVHAFLSSISEKLRAATTAAAKFSCEEAWMVKCNIGKREWLGPDRRYRACDVAVSAWIEPGRPMSTYDRQQLARSVILHLIDNSNNTIWELAFAVDTNNIVTIISVNANLGDGTVTPINIDVKPTPISPPADFDWRDTSKSLPPNSVRVLTKTNEAPGEIVILTRYEKFWFRNDVYVFYVPDYWAPLPAADNPQ